MNAKTRIPCTFGAALLVCATWVPVKNSRACAAETAAAKPAGKPVKLAAWAPPGNVRAEPVTLGGETGKYKVWGIGGIVHRKYFDGFLPALFERTLAVDEVAEGTALSWIFTGPRGGVTVMLDSGRREVQVVQRFYDSFAFTKMGGKLLARHPEWRDEPVRVSYTGKLAAITFRMDHTLRWRLLLNGAEVLERECPTDLTRHQISLTGGKGRLAGRMLRRKAADVTLTVDPGQRHQTMLGFGGITTPTAYAQLSEAGKEAWWRLIAEYNLLIQREYPNGRRLNPDMDNWDTLADATPHYYGDNFPNGEISDFDYIKRLRAMGGQVWFEFWDLPTWVDVDPETYARAMVDYCKTSQERAGAPPDVVGIQNEHRQSEAMWHKMTLALRRRLDEAGFKSVRIHMSDASMVHGGIKRARAFRADERVWSTIDYAAVHMYDYQRYFSDPDRFDKMLRQWHELTADKPFLSTELCINSGRYQWPGYRVALTMGQLYHKNLVLTDAIAICYCWTLLNVVQPSYGWTRSLCVPDRSDGFSPAAASNQLRVFGAYSRRVRRGMVRVGARSSDPDVLATAFVGQDGSRTVVALNRSSRPVRLGVQGAGGGFTVTETVSPYAANAIATAPKPGPKAGTRVSLGPGEVITLSNVSLLGEGSENR